MLKRRMTSATLEKSRLPYKTANMAYTCDLNGYVGRDADGYSPLWYGI